MLFADSSLLRASPGPLRGEDSGAHACALCDPQLLFAKLMWVYREGGKQEPCRLRVRSPIPIHPHTVLRMPCIF